jgi:hypothetical protein
MVLVPQVAHWVTGWLPVHLAERAFLHQDHSACVACQQCSRTLDYRSQWLSVLSDSLELDLFKHPTRNLISCEPCQSLSLDLWHCLGVLHPFKEVVELLVKLWGDTARK